MMSRKEGIEKGGTIYLFNNEIEKSILFHKSK